MQNGGKAASLTKLIQGGFSVPPFFSCDNTWTEEQVCQQIKVQFSNVQYFAVRSSAESEDSKEKSFAGHFYSAVGVETKDVYKEIQKVQESFNGMAGSMIVQEFIPSDVAGVIFSDIGDEKIIINAIHGLCTTVVSGGICDEYVFKHDALVDKNIPTNKIATFFQSGRMVSQGVSAESLDVHKTKELITVAKKIQRFFGSPQDIEWCYWNGSLYILQARPITKGIVVGDKEYFDSANIAESYSGIVLPLTYTFAKLVYEQVYRDLLHMSGVSLKKIEQRKDIFQNLLGHFYGRMYYNMNNWYQMAAFVPGYKRNKENFELMITSNVRESITATVTPSLGLKIFYPFLVVYKVCTFGITSIYFNWLVRTELKKLRAHDFSRLKYEACVSMFHKLNDKLLRRWYIAIENDFFVMTYLGVLKKLVDDATLQELITFQSKATEQTHALVEMSKKARAIQRVWGAIESNDAALFKQMLAEHEDLNTLLNTYLDTFGGRFANELKLESIGVDEDVTKLLAVLKIYADYEPKQYEHAPVVDLPFFKKILVMFILKKFKKYASRREVFRLLRSNTFAVARRLFRQIGRILVAQSVLDAQDDIFYLQLDEILNVELVGKERLRELVEQRKKDYVAYKEVRPPVHFVTTGATWPTLLGSSEDVLEQGRPASPGVIRGKVKVFKEFFMPEKIDFDILVTSHTDPGWTSLIALSKGLIIEHGGVLSHASIVARELSIPAVIGATNAVTHLKDGQVVEIDGSTGSIKLL